MRPLILAVTVSAAFATGLAAAQAPAKVSSFGTYSGYSTPRYAQWVRTSQYVTVRDGTRIAVDVIRPAVNGVAVGEPTPVVVEAARYHRARGNQNGILSYADLNPTYQTLLAHGYATAVYDVRGAGASFGSRAGEVTEVEARDAYDVIEWLAVQPWCSGKVGMQGFSYDGLSQLLAASQKPPHLAAIIPSVPTFDSYDVFYGGGIFRQSFVRGWSDLIAFLDREQRAVLVDEDKDGKLEMAAKVEHQANLPVFGGASTLPYRDSVVPTLGKAQYLKDTVSSHVVSISAAGVPTYLHGGWFDSFTRDQAQWFANLDGPKRMVFAPFPHALSPVQGWSATVLPLLNFAFTPPGGGTFLTTEHLRFYDRYLKGVENGIDREPPVTYLVMGAPAASAWRKSNTWPLQNEVRTRYYLQTPKSGTIDSTNDGHLGTTRPQVPREPDRYTVDYSVTTGGTTRWHAATGGGFGYPDMRAQDRKSLTYTTAPLAADSEITGHPVVHLWVSSTAKDGDFFAYLEEVDATGRAWYITEGQLRASHRRLATPAWKNLGLPWHRSFQEDLRPLTPGEPTELTFDLQPTSNLFDKGHRIRVRLSGADAGNAATPVLQPAPTVSIYRDRERASYIDLPLIPAR